MDKKALSDLVTIVLVIGLVLSLAVLVLYWSSSLIKKTTREADITAEKSITCLRDVELSISDVCYDTAIKLSIENKKDAAVNGDFLLIKVE